MPVPSLAHVLGNYFFFPELLLFPLDPHTLWKSSLYFKVIRKRWIMLRKMRFVYIFSRRSPGRDEHRNVRYVEANSRLFQGIPQFPVPTSLTYDTCNTGWYFIVAHLQNDRSIAGCAFGARNRESRTYIHIFTTAISGHAALRREWCHLFWKKKWRLFGITRAKRIPFSAGNASDIFSAHSTDLFLYLL